MSANSLNRGLLAMPYVIPDPGVAGTIRAAEKYRSICLLGASSTLVYVAAPARTGQQLTVVDAGEAGLVNVTLYDSSGAYFEDTILYFSGSGQRSKTYVSITVNGVLTWKEVSP